MGTPWLEELEVRQLLTGVAQGLSSFLPQASSISQERLASTSLTHGLSGDHINSGSGVHTAEMGAHADSAPTRDSPHIGWNETTGPNLDWRDSEDSGIGGANNRDGGRRGAGSYASGNAESPEREAAKPLWSAPLSDYAETSVARAVDAVFEQTGTAHPGSVVSQADLVALPALSAIQSPGWSVARANGSVSAAELSLPHPWLPVELLNLPRGGTQQTQETPSPHWLGLREVLRSLPHGNLGSLEAGIREFLNNLSQVGKQFWAQSGECRLTAWVIAGAAAAAACEIARRQLRKPEIDPTERTELLGLTAEEDERRRS
jgi:hypothetical protein